MFLRIVIGVAAMVPQCAFGVKPSVRTMQRNTTAARNIMVDVKMQADMRLATVSTYVGMSRQGCVGATSYLSSGWENKWDKDLYFSCPSSGVVTRLISQHNNYREDRQWKFGCNDVVCLSVGQAPTSHYVNKWDQILNFTCPSNSVVTGFYSRHSNHKEDRLWKIKCSAVDGQVSSGEWSALINDWDLDMDYTCPDETVLTGLFSQHNNYREDRRWRIKCGTVAAPGPEVFGSTTTTTTPIFSTMEANTNACRCSGNKYTVRIPDKATCQAAAHELGSALNVWGVANGYPEYEPYLVNLNVWEMHDPWPKGCFVDSNPLRTQVWFNTHDNGGTNDNASPICMEDQTATTQCPTPSPTPSPTAAPTPTASAYYEIMEPGTNACTSNTVRIPDKSTCQVAAHELGSALNNIWGVANGYPEDVPDQVNLNVQEMHSDYLPKGCYVASSPFWLQVYFNTHENGGTRANGWPICMRLA